MSAYVFTIREKKTQTRQCEVHISTLGIYWENAYLKEALIDCVVLKSSQHFDCLLCHLHMQILINI